MAFIHSEIRFFQKKNKVSFKIPLIFLEMWALNINAGFPAISQFAVNLSAVVSASLKHFLDRLDRLELNSNST